MQQMLSKCRWHGPQSSLVLAGVRRPYELSTREPLYDAKHFRLDISSIEHPSHLTGSIACMVLVLRAHAWYQKLYRCTCALDLQVVVNDMLSETTDELPEFRDRVIKISLGEWAASVPAAITHMPSNQPYSVQGSSSNGSHSHHSGRGNCEQQQLGCMAWDRCAAGVQTHLCACLSCVCYMRAVLVAGFGYLIVATSTQCHVYACSNLNTPHIFDLKDTVTLILQVSDALTKYQPALIAMAAAKALLQYNIHASKSGCAPVCKQASLDC